MNEDTKDMEYLPPVYNASRMAAFAKSGNCPDRYRDLPPDKLFDEMGDGGLRDAYGAYTMLSWMREVHRRRNANLPQSEAQRLQLMVRVEEATEAVSRRGDAVQPPTGGGKRYERLFADSVNAKEWSDVELEVRKMFLDELEKAKGSGGCSGCKRGRLVAKYVGIVRRMTEDSGQV